MSGIVYEKPSIGQSVRMVERRRNYQAERESPNAGPVIDEVVTDVVITKVGRKYATVTWDTKHGVPSTREFNWSDGYPREAFSPRSVRFYSETAWRDEQRLRAAQEAIAAAGLELRKKGGYGMPTLPIETWEAVALAVAGGGS